METLLFNTKKVKKFFGILNKLSGGYPADTSNYPWRDYLTIYTKDSNHIPSTREVFVHRTINKWFKGSYLIIYRMSDYGQLYKQYYSITILKYENDYDGGHINVGTYDYAQPWGGSLFGGEKITEYAAIMLEGEWCDNGEKHKQVEKLFSMEDILDKEYIFEAYDFSKYDKKTKTFFKTNIPLKAKTRKDAYKQRDNFEKKCKETRSSLILAPDIIEIKGHEDNNS